MSGDLDGLRREMTRDSLITERLASELERPCWRSRRSSRPGDRGGSWSAGGSPGTAPVRRPHRGPHVHRPADQRARDRMAGAAAMSGMPRWPLFLIAAPAAVGVWSGWVGLGGLCGFGIVYPLPGIWDALRVDTAIALPVGVEAYGACALRAWLTPGTPKRPARLPAGPRSAAFYDPSCLPDPPAGAGPSRKRWRRSAACGCRASAREGAKATAAVSASSARCGTEGCTTFGTTRRTPASIPARRRSQPIRTAGRPADTRRNISLNRPMARFAAPCHR